MQPGWFGVIRSILFIAAALALAATPAAAQQQLGSDGDAFLKAMRDGDANRAVDLLTKPGSTVTAYRGPDGDTGLLIATRNRDSTWVGYLLSRGADPNMGDRKGDTPLILASRLGFAEGAARLLGRRALVDKPNRLGETPLIVAVQQRHPALVRMLLEAGANPDKADHASGYSARDYARRDSRSPELLKLIETVKSKKAATVGPVRP